MNPALTLLVSVPLVVMTFFCPGISIFLMAGYMAGLALTATVATIVSLGFSLTARGTISALVQSAGLVGFVLVAPLAAVLALNSLTSLPWRTISMVAALSPVSASLAHPLKEAHFFSFDAQGELWVFPAFLALYAILSLVAFLGVNLLYNMKLRRSARS